MVFQNYALFPHMTVRQNIGFGLRCAACRRPRSSARSTRRWPRAPRRARSDKLPGQLSGGQQQRVAIARAIVIEPPLVLMDEPLSNLDAKLRLEMRAEIRRIHNVLGATTIYVTHDQDEALSLADRIVVLRDGVIRQVGTPEELYARARASRRRRVHGLPQPAARARSSPIDGGRAVVDVGGRADQRHRPGASSPVGRRRIVAIRPDDLDAVEPAAMRIAATRRDDRISRPRIRRDGAYRRNGARARLPLRTIRVEPGESDPSGASTPSACSSSRSRQGSVTDASHRPPASSTVPASASASPHAGFDAVTLLVVPAALFVLLLFVYPFLYGLRAVVRAEGRRRWLANYARFFSDPFLYETIANDALARAARHAPQPRCSRCRSRSACG